MITASKLKELVNLKADSLQALMGKKAKNYVFTSAMFTGITNAGQLCYHVVYTAESITGSTKVFLTLDYATEGFTADF